MNELDDTDTIDSSTDSGESYVDDGAPPAANRSATNRSTMILVGLVLIGACVVYFMYFKKGPASAQAATAAEAEAASHTINQFLVTGGENIRLMQRLMRGTEKVVQQFQNYPSAAQVPLSELKTNPFRYEAPVTSDPGAAQERERQQRAQERQAILSAVQALQLTMIMYNDTRPACIINNTLYNEGAQVGQFTIDRISSDSIIVKSGSYRFELRMQR